MRQESDGATAQRFFIFAIVIIILGTLVFHGYWTFTTMDRIEQKLKEISGNP